VKGGEVLVSIAQVAAGGTIVQAVMAFIRRRSELRQLDRQTDSVAVETADHVVVILRTELDAAKAEIKDLKTDHASERTDMQRQVQILGERVSRLNAELVIAQSEIVRLQRGDKP
jgi:multidrug resistance efflux pump